jgi:O-antigen/teichoic acid export membrane protein
MDATTTRRWTPTFLFLGVLLIANAVALWLAWQDQSWGALAIALYIGPAMNAALAIAGLAATPILRRRRLQFPARGHAIFSIAAPLVIAGVDLAAIFAMPLRGC